MKQEILLKQKIGMRISRAGLLSKVFAIQSFAKDGCELRPEQFTVLNALKENDGMYLRQLANITYKDRPNITRIVSILEEKGYLKSSIEAEGRQVKKLYITQEGKDVCDKLLPTILKIWGTSVEGLKEEEVDTFLRVLDRIEINLKDKTILQI